MRPDNRPTPGSGLPCRKTLADYVGIAISPALIMTLVGSLVYFLLEISYSGEFQSTLRWTLAWFVFAMVLISRIAIEQEAGLAMVYGFMLALATAMMVSQYLGSQLVVWGILGLIWWCANKLTWDCTLINDEEDASGQGLLDAAAAGEKKAADSTPPSEPAATPSQPPSPAPLLTPLPAPASKWHGGKPLLLPPRLPLPPPIPGPAPAQPGSSTTKPRPGGAKPATSIFNWLSRRRQKMKKAKLAAQPHAPGLWVVYFSLAALPVFGFGQGLVSKEDPQQRYVFHLLLIYVASGLGLLLITSFLGLRRYLRQRRLRMPVSIAATWMTMGSVMATGILGFCLLLPRPAIEGSSAPKFLDRLTQPKDTSGDGAPKQSAAGTQGRPAGQGSASGRRGSSLQSNPDRQDNTGTSPSPKPVRSNNPLFDWLRWVIWGLMVVVLLLWVGRHWGRIWTAFKQWWRSSRHPPKPAPIQNESPAPIPRPFSAFTNPFLGGDEPRTSPTELVIYTFNAMAAWAGEQSCPHRPDQTPLEFGRNLAGYFPGLNPESWQIAQLYSRLAYAGQIPPRESLEVLRKLWGKIEGRG